MSDEYSFLLIRVMRGEESLGTAFWVSLFLLVLWFSYEFYIPSVTDVFQPFFYFFDGFIIAYAVIAMWLSCSNSGLFMRTLVRLYALVLLAGGAFIMRRHFGPLWAYAYPVITMLLGFIVRE